MLNGKTAIVTGGTRGIGKAIAIELAKKGADVAIFATKQNEASTNVVNEIKVLGKKVIFKICNVENVDQVNNAVAEVIQEFGKIDILVNNAGITRDMLLLQMKDEDFEKVLSVNLTGCFHMTKACIRPFMKQKSGKIINISSVVGIMGNAGQVNYAASKAGVIGLTKSIAKEYAAKGITCNAVAPGYIKTDMTQELNEDASQAILNRVPLKRYGTTQDIANLVGFLADDVASYITGAVIQVDGGLNM